MRAVGGSVAPTNQRVWPFTRRSRTPLTSNSVFGFYSPLYPVSRSSEIEPEFQIYGPNEPGRRGNFHGQVLANPGGDIPVSFASRRNFLQETARLAAATGRGCIGRLNARAQTVPSSPSGYRALVGVCLLGGTDGHTRSLPMSGVARRKYLAARGSRSRPDGTTPVLPIAAKNGTPYGLNGGLAALYPFWALGKLAGVGTLGMGGSRRRGRRSAGRRWACRGISCRTRTRSWRCRRTIPLGGRGRNARARCGGRRWRRNPPGRRCRGGCARRLKRCRAKRRRRGGTRTGQWRCAWPAGMRCWRGRV